MNTAAPDGTPMRRLKRISRMLKPSCGAVPRRGPEGGILAPYLFHVPEVNLIRSCTFWSSLILAQIIKSRIVNRHQVVVEYSGLAFITGNPVPHYCGNTHYPGNYRQDRMDNRKMAYHYLSHPCRYFPGPVKSGSCLFFSSKIFYRNGQTRKKKKKEF